MPAVTAPFETKFGNLTLRLRKTPTGFGAVAIKNGEVKAREDGNNADDVWRRIHDAATRLNPLFIGYSSARARFLHFFPDGFAGADYTGTERDYKVAAKALLDRTAPLAEAARGEGFGEAALAVFNKTNLLAPQEKPRMRDLLRGADGDAFVRLAAAFALDPGPSTLTALKVLLKPHDAAKWTFVTYLPFLWRPEAHFFLKPTMLTTFADRVGHRFARLYRADLDIEVYDALLDLAAKTRDEITDMGPRDMIDIQSFMWTVVEYKEEDKAAPVEGETSNTQIA